MVQFIQQEQDMFVTDVHFGARGGNELFFTYMMKFFNEQVFPIMQEKGIKRLYILGDFTDSRKGTDYRITKRIKKEFFDVTLELGFEVIVLCGNHDIFYNDSNEIVSFETMLDEKHTHVTAISQQCVEVGDYLVIPWINKENYDEVMAAVEATDKKYALGHLEISGAKMYATSVSEHGLDSELFSKFDRVLTGHYHHANDYGKVTYIGAAGYYTWQDYGDFRGLTLFSPTTNTLEQVENKFCNFMKFEYDDSAYDHYTGGVDFCLLNEKHVELRITGKEDINKYNEVLKLFKDARPISLRIVDETIVTEQVKHGETEVNFDDDVVALLEEQFEEHDDKEELISLSNELHKEALVL